MHLFFIYLPIHHLYLGQQKHNSFHYIDILKGTLLCHLLENGLTMLMTHPALQGCCASNEMLSLTCSLPLSPFFTSSTAVFSSLLKHSWTVHVGDPEADLSEQSQQGSTCHFMGPLNLYALAKAS